MAVINDLSDLCERALRIIATDVDISAIAEFRETIPDFNNDPTPCVVQK